VPQIEKVIPQTFRTVLRRGVNYPLKTKGGEMSLNFSKGFDKVTCIHLPERWE